MSPGQCRPQAALLASTWPSHPPVVASRADTPSRGDSGQARKSPAPKGHNLLWGQGDPAT